MNEYRLYAGIDWAAEVHQVCVVDARGSRVLEQRFEHSAEGLAQMAERLRALVDEKPAEMAVSIETPRGAVVEMLLENDFAVHSINPKQLDRLRD